MKKSESENYPEVERESLKTTHNLKFVGSWSADLEVSYNHYLHYSNISSA